MTRLRCSPGAKADPAADEFASPPSRLLERTLPTFTKPGIFAQAVLIKAETRFLLFALAALLAASPRVHAQGGPPMITDDPGTPGDRHWEINLAWTDQRTHGSTQLGLPLLDANYGVGDRIQLNYQASWNVVREQGAEQENGMSDSQLALKWRFYDAVDAGLQLSTYPRLTFPSPGSDSDERWTADPHSSFLLPIEARRDFGLISVNAEFGRMFSGSADDRGWIGGLCVGREVSKGWELDAEIHLTADDRFGRSETILNAGSRYDFDEHATLLLAIGRDLRNSLETRVPLLTYVGVQVRL